MPAQFKITDFQYKLEFADGELEVYESNFPIKVRYQGPYFYFDVKVACTVPNGESWTVAFVQSCDAIELRHTYTSGNYTRWEFPTPISDSTTQSFPYYSLGAPNNSGRNNQTGVGRVTVNGPANAQVADLSMNDNLNSNVQWWDAVAIEQSNYTANSGQDTLQRILRKQRFSTYVIAHKGALTATSDYQTLGKISWRMAFSLDFDCTKQKGQRVTKKYEEGHAILFRSQSGGGKLPACCFVNNNANAAQRLVGYAANGSVVKQQINW